MGEVVLIRGHDVWIIHRIVGFENLEDRDLVFHCGDAGGGIGICSRDQVVGRPIALLVGKEAIAFDGAPEGPVRVAFLAAQERCGRYMRIRRLGQTLQLHRIHCLAPLVRLTNRFLASPA
jgi:hypothetical protein